MQLDEENIHKLAMSLTDLALYQTSLREISVVARKLITKMSLLLVLPSKILLQMQKKLDKKMLRIGINN